MGCERAAMGADGRAHQLVSVLVADEERQRAAELSKVSAVTNFRASGNGNAFRGAGVCSTRRVSRGTVVLALLLTIVMLCTKMLSVDQNPRRLEAVSWDNAMPMRAHLNMVVAHLRAQAARATRQQLTLEEAERPLTTVAGSNGDKEFRELTKEAMKKVGERKKQASERAHIEEVEAREKSQEDKYASKEKAERDMAAGIEPDQHDNHGAAVLGSLGGQPSNGGGKQRNINAAYLHDTGGERGGTSPSMSALPKMLGDAAAAAAAEVHVGSRAAAAIASAYVQHQPQPRQQASNTLLSDARSVVQALESEGSIILQGSELEMRRVAEVMLVPDLKALVSQRPNAGHLKSFKSSAGNAGEREPGGAHRALGSGVGVGLAPRHWGPETRDAGTGSGSGSVEEINPVRFLQPVPTDGSNREMRDFIHTLRHGITDSNSSAYRDIEQADRMVTEPDDIVKMEDELRRLNKYHRIAAQVAEHHSQSTNSNTSHQLGVFRWVEDAQEETRQHVTNSSYGTWVWCRNESNFDGLKWVGGSLVGAPVIKPHQKFVFIDSCVSVAGPGFVEGEEEDTAREEALRKAKIEEDEIVELQKRNWDQPFMTYEPHPSAVGWNKVHWTVGDWTSWLLTGPLLSLLFTACIISVFGWLPGAAAALLCIAVDTATYYWNW